MIDLVGRELSSLSCRLPIDTPAGHASEGRAEDVMNDASFGLVRSVGDEFDAIKLADASLTERSAISEAEEAGRRRVAG